MRVAPRRRPDWRQPGCLAGPRWVNLSFRAVARPRARSRADMPALVAENREMVAPLGGDMRQRPRRAVVWTWWACLAGLFAWMFADVLWAANNFVDRDAAHFYHPLFKYIA